MDDSWVGADLYFDDLPTSTQTKLSRLGFPRSKYNQLTLGERMAALTCITPLEVNSLIEVRKDLPYFVLALEDGLNGGTISNVPQKAFQNVEEAARYAQTHARRNHPLFVVKVVVKVEIAPPPTVVTSFDE